MMIRSKTKSLYRVHVFSFISLWAKLTLKACTSEANSPFWPEIELDQDFMPVLVFCKCEQDPIKTEGAIVSTIFFPGLKGS